MDYKFIEVIDGKEVFDYKKMLTFDVLGWVRDNESDVNLKLEFAKLYDRDNARESGRKIKTMFYNVYKGKLEFKNLPKKRPSMTEEEKKQKAKERAEKKKAEKRSMEDDILKALGI